MSTLQLRLKNCIQTILYLALIMSVVSCVNYCYGFYRKIAAKNAAE